MNLSDTDQTKPDTAGRKKEINAWCEKDRERRKSANRYWMTGCEDEVLILFEGPINFESISRAREMLIIVTDNIKS